MPINKCNYCTEFFTSIKFFHFYPYKLQSVLQLERNYVDMFRKQLSYHNTPTLRLVEVKVLYVLQQIIYLLNYFSQP